VACLKDLFDMLYLKYRGNVLFVTPMERVDAEHVRLYDDIAAGNLEGARDVLARHIANVKEHAVSSIERMKHEKHANI
jgi:DNA-binding FadR family transcriptional regulator